MVLPEGFIIEGFSVRYLIKENAFCSSYKVTNKVGKSFFMKVFDLKAIPSTLISDGCVLEIKYTSEFNHESLQRQVAKGEIVIEGNRYAYLVTDFFYGSLLSEIVGKDLSFTLREIQKIILRLASALEYLRQFGLVHNDLCPGNILISNESGGDFQLSLIDFGHATRPFSGKPPFPTDDLDPLYCAPETFDGAYSEKSDVFSLAAIMYALLYGKAPWQTIISEDATYEEKLLFVKQARMEALNFARPVIGIIPSIRVLLQYALSLDASKRLSLDVFIKSVKNGGIHIDDIPSVSSHRQEVAPASAERTDMSVEKETFKEQENRGVKGNGFADVAGMEELKSELTKRVIWVLRDKSIAKEYRIKPPNGMLLYGPPGCGKTYFAKKFAEETGFNYMLVNGSDLGSTLVHGTQIKIAELFKKAEESAPTVLCFDEFDAFVPKRGERGSEYQADEINEFLAQLNNCSEKGIFVIGTTNRKDMIDPAILRKGRMDLIYQIPAPDQDTRSAMFRLHLKDRPLAEDIDVEELASLTDGYAASDIDFIVNEAALVAAYARERISQKHLVNAIKCNPSSIGVDASERRKIGF